MANLLDLLNAYSAKRVDKSDFDCCIEAFTTLNEKAYVSFTPTEWLPVLHNILYFIQDPDELAVHCSSAQVLKHFVNMVAQNPDSEYQPVFLCRLFPALKNGLHSKNEQVCAEILGVVAYAVSSCDEVTSLVDMRILLAGGDEEANFSNNIHHV